jgi:hypothetical protein
MSESVHCQRDRAILAQDLDRFLCRTPSHIHPYWLFLFNVWVSLEGSVQIRFEERGVVDFQCPMPESAGLNGCLDEIELEFVEGEATPELLLKLAIQLHLTGL